MYVSLLIFSLRVAFVSPAKEIRAAALRALRHLLQTEEQAKVVLNQRLDVFITRLFTCIFVYFIAPLTRDKTLSSWTKINFYPLIEF